MIVTAVKNAAGGDWVYLSPYAQYLVRPPKPVWITTMWPPSIQLQAPAGTQWLHSANMESQIIDIALNLPQQYGYAEYVLSLDDGSISSMGDDGGDWWAGYLPCSVLSGTYELLRARNWLDYDESAWAEWGDIAFWGLTTQTIIPCGQ
jgi:hypothetical protein